MPKLINYLNRLGPGEFYSDLKVEQLQQAFDEACTRLRLPAGDGQRERVAMMIFEEAKAGMDNLPARIIARFGLLG